MKDYIVLFFYFDDNSSNIKAKMIIFGVQLYLIYLNMSVKFQINLLQETYIITL